MHEALEGWSVLFSPEGVSGLIHGAGVILLEKPYGRVASTTFCGPEFFLVLLWKFCHDSQFCPSLVKKKNM